MTSQPMQQIPGIYHRRIGDIVVTAVSDGYLDGSLDVMRNVDLDAAHRILKEAFNAGGPVAVDLLGTTFIDSTVLRILICARETATQRGVGFRIALGDTTGHGVRRLLELTGMEHRLSTAPTRAAAIAGAAGAGPS